MIKFFLGLISSALAAYTAWRAAVREKLVRQAGRDEQKITDMIEAAKTGEAIRKEEAGPRGRDVTEKAARDGKF